MPRATRLGLRSAHLGAGQGQKMACGHQLAAIANGPLAANRFPVAASTQSDVRRGRVATPCALLPAFWVTLERRSVQARARRRLRRFRHPLFVA